MGTYGSDIIVIQLSGRSKVTTTYRVYDSEIVALLWCFCGEAHRSQSEGEMKSMQEAQCPVCREKL